MKSTLIAILFSLGVAMSQDMQDSIVTRHDNVWIAEQPGLDDLDAWAAAGARVVVNSRTPEETAGLPFDLAAEVEARGMQYVEMPIGGAHGANPAHTTALASLLENADGPVVMHCRSGTRSAHLYSAHLMSQDPEMSEPFDAIEWPGGRDMNMARALTPE